jgi:hypothetical protein
MSTLRQIEANRRNSQKSTGPTSVTGKAASSMNALKTGIHAKSLVLPSENQAELEELIEDCYQSFRPATPEARIFVDDFIYCEWSLRRLRAAETEAWRYQDDNIFRGPEKYPLGHSVTQNPNSFSRLQYRMDATRRARERALQALKQLQAEAAAAPVPAPTVEREDPPSLTPSPQTSSPLFGFVLPTPSAPPSEPPSPGAQQSSATLTFVRPSSRFPVVSRGRKVHTLTGSETSNPWVLGVSNRDLRD